MFNYVGVGEGGVEPQILIGGIKEGSESSHLLLKSWSSFSNQTNKNKQIFTIQLQELFLFHPLHERFTYLGIREGGVMPDILPRGMK